MKKLILVLLIFVPILLNGQAWISSNIISGSENIVVLKGTKDSQNNTLVFGYFTGTINLSSGENITSFGGRDLFLTKFDQNQNLLWFKRYGSTQHVDILGGVTTDVDDNIYISSAFRGNLYYNETDYLENTGLIDMFTAKLDPNGNIVWIKQSGIGASLQRSTAIKTTSQNEFILTGNFLDSINFNNDTTLYANNGNVNYFYSKFSSETGDLIWAKGVNSITGFLGGFLYDVNIGSDYYVFSGVFLDSTGFENDTIVSLDNSNDAHILVTDFDGNIQWLRTIQSSLSDFSYKSVIDNDDNIYVTGYYYGSPLTVQINSTEYIDIAQQAGEADYFFIKFDKLGNLIWSKTAGGAGDDRIVDAAFFNNQINVSGLFSDALNWGGIELTTNGLNDQDMFIGALDLDGNFRSANGYSGRNNSSENTRTIFSDGTDLFTVIRTNTDLLVLGDSTYLNPSENYFVALGVIGCPEMEASVFKVGVTPYAGLHTGSIRITATGGNEGTFRYSIDNGESYQESNVFSNLEVGIYNVVVLDAENCSKDLGEAQIIERARVFSHNGRRPLIF